MLKIVSRSRSEVARIASDLGPARERPRKRPPTILIGPLSLRPFSRTAATRRTLRPAPRAALRAALRPAAFESAFGSAARTAPRWSVAARRTAPGPIVAAARRPFVPRAERSLAPSVRPVRPVAAVSPAPERAIAVPARTLVGAWPGTERAVVIPARTLAPVLARFPGLPAVARGRRCARSAARAFVPRARRAFLPGLADQTLDHHFAALAGLDRADPLPRALGCGHAVLPRIDAARSLAERPFVPLLAGAPHAALRLETRGTLCRLLLATV